MYVCVYRQINREIRDRERETERAEREREERDENHRKESKLFWDRTQKGPKKKKHLSRALKNE